MIEGDADDNDILKFIDDSRKTTTHVCRAGKISIFFQLTLGFFYAHTYIYL